MHGQKHEHILMIPYNTDFRLLQFFMRHKGQQLDGVERLNYLAQISNWAAQNQRLALARRYNMILTQSAQKQQVRLPTLVKRAICKTCLANIDDSSGNSRIRTRCNY